MSNYHVSVLLKEAVEALDIKKDGIYVDLTFGGGGHSKEILKALSGGKLFAFDKDADANQNKLNDAGFELIKQDFRFFKNYLKFYKINQVDGILADLGVSSHQFDEAERGFSIRFDAPLDMRMDNKQVLTAKKIINEYEAVALAKVFRNYGELNNAMAIANAIDKKRAEKPIETTGELIECIKHFVPAFKSNKFLAQVFQALRIEVNQEMKALEEMLVQTTDALKQGGRLVIISYHSLEDRMVKNFMKSGNLKGDVEKDFFGRAIVPFKPISRKPIIPTEEEIELNPRARSAKMRIIEKL
jgi:16S rRNA (cytosine1402-N4)-methyltransferase